jgi:ParB family chromosome partitioning protein
MKNQQREFRELPLNLIDVVSNTREEFDSPAMQELKNSIKTNGVKQPILVKPADDGRYRLICGERRFRASESLGLVCIPAMIEDIADDDILPTQIIENSQRKGLTVFEEATAFRRMRDELFMSQTQIAAKTGKDQKYISMYLTIADGDESLLDALKNKHLLGQVAVLISKTAKEHQAEAVAVLRRRDGKLVQIQAAKEWLNKRFGVQPKTPKVRTSAQPKISKQLGRFAADWKYYFLRFNGEQFLSWKKIVSNNDNVTAWADAVETVMTEAAKH